MDLTKVDLDEEEFARYEDICDSMSEYLDEIGYTLLDLEFRLCDDRHGMEVVAVVDYYGESINIKTFLEERSYLDISPNVIGYNLGVSSCKFIENSNTFKSLVA